MSDGLDDETRLAAVRATGFVGAPPDARLQRIARIVSRLLDAPLALATLVDDERQYVIAEEGPDAAPFEEQRQVPLTHSFCQHVVRRDSTLRVQDAREMPLLADNPSIEEGVIAYLGAPVRGPDGSPLGALCVIDAEPRAWTDADERAITDMAGMVGEELTLREQSIWDELTGLHNRRHWTERAPIELSRAKRENAPLAVVALTANRSDPELLESLGARWRPSVRPPDVLVRWEGSLFMLLLVAANGEQARGVASRLAEGAADLCSISIGIAEWNGEEQADALLHRARG